MSDKDRCEPIYDNVLHDFYCRIETADGFRCPPYRVLESGLPHHFSIPSGTIPRKKFANKGLNSLLMSNLKAPAGMSSGFGAFSLLHSAFLIVCASPIASASENVAASYELLYIEGLIELNETLVSVVVRWSTLLYKSYIHKIQCKVHA